jgi:hypothetical protein
MKLITKAISNKMPNLYETDGQGDKAIIQAKLFTPDSSFTWYILEMDQESGDCFGIVTSNLNYNQPEYGYFNINELKDVRGQLGLPVERDLWFGKKTVGEMKKDLN